MEQLLTTTPVTHSSPYPEMIRMRLEQWAAIPDNPVQRNTEHHAAPRKSPHLRKQSRLQYDALVARLPDGRMIKLDGHTRAYVWTVLHEGFPPPDGYMNVRIIDASDMADVEVLYHACDNIDSGKDAPDRMVSALRAEGLALSSPRLRSGGYVEAFRIAYRILHRKVLDKHEYQKALREFRDELLLIDTVNPSTTGRDTGVFNNALMAAALLTTRKHGERAILGFWMPYRLGEGSREAGSVDGVQALHELRLKRTHKEGGGATTVDVMGRAISACEGQLIGQRWTQGLKRTDPYKYAERLPKRTEP